MSDRRRPGRILPEPDWPRSKGMRPRMTVAFQACLMGKPDAEVCKLARITNETLQKWKSDGLWSAAWHEERNAFGLTDEQLKQRIRREALVAGHGAIRRIVKRGETAQSERVAQAADEYLVDQSIGKVPAVATGGVTIPIEALKVLGDTLIASQQRRAQPAPVAVEHVSPA